MDEFQEILQDFLIESFELIEQLDQDLTLLETQPDDLDLLNRIFRVAHTIKGASSFLNFDVLTHLTHHMEDVLNKARHNELSITAEVMDVILPSIDQMKDLLYTIRDTGSDEGKDVTDIVSRLDVVAGGNGIIEGAPAADAPVAAEPEPVATPEEPAEEVDYSNMSDSEVDAEIERLLAERQSADKERRAQKATEEVAAVSAPEPAAAPTPEP
ncbi:MAG: Hpt domain-containing protein, partial [Thiovulaceae bacterium]|nr:Hpt domain-containing protein [Sulfurimonadaceae bacterium]